MFSIQQVYLVWSNFCSPSFKKLKLNTQSWSIRVGGNCVVDVTTKQEWTKSVFPIKHKFKIWQHKTNLLYATYSTILCCASISNQLTHVKNYWAMEIH